MQINDTWEIEDAVSGLRLKIIPGTKQDRLHVESLTGGTATDDHPKMNRDFWFTKAGTFDGTGSVVEDMPNAEGQGCRASRHTLDPFVGSLNQEE